MLTLIPLNIEEYISRVAFRMQVSPFLQLSRASFFPCPINWALVAPTCPSTMRCSLSFSRTYSLRCEVPFHGCIMMWWRKGFHLIHREYLCLSTDSGDSLYIHFQGQRQFHAWYSITPIVPVDMVCPQDLQSRLGFSSPCSQNMHPVKKKMKKTLFLKKCYRNRRLHFIFPGLVSLGESYGNWSWILEEGATFQGV